MAWVWIRILLKFKILGQLGLNKDCLKEQSDQGLHCLQFHLHLLDLMLYFRNQTVPSLGLLW